MRSIAVLRLPHLFRLRPVVIAAAVVMAMVPFANAQQPAGAVPNFSGVWQRAGGPGALKTVDGQPIPFQPWAREIYDQSVVNSNAGKPFIDNRTICLPDGGVDVLFTPYAIQFVQTADKLVMLTEFNNQMRFVYLNQQHPADLKPSWNGHSVGHFEGNTLVVDTIGFNDRTPLLTLFDGGRTRSDVRHTAQLHLIERYTLDETGNVLRNEMTFEDPGTFTRPWGLVLTSNRSDYRIPEFVCADAPLDLEG